MHTYSSLQPALALGLAFWKAMFKAILLTNRVQDKRTLSARPYIVLDAIIT